MTMRRILLLFLCLIVVVGMVEAKNGKTAKAQDIVTPYKIWKTSVAPVIDGKLDKIWLSVPWTMQNFYFTGGVNPDSQSYQGMSKAMWDDNNLYVIVYNQAPNILDAPSNGNWNQSANEIYIGATDAKANPRIATDYQFTFSHYYGSSANGFLGAATGSTAQPFDTTGTVFAISNDDATTSDATAGLGGWFFEISIPLDKLNIPAVGGTLIGWDIQQDEVTAGGTSRNAQSNWWCQDNSGWQRSDTWGEAVLSSEENLGQAKVVKATAAPAIDGVMDAQYMTVQQDANYWRFVDGNGSDIPDPTAGNVKLSSMWDADNLYMFFDVNDQNITDVPTNPLWNQSAVEWYLGPNDKGTSYSALDHQLQIANYLKGKEAAVGTPTTVWTGQAKIDSTGCAFKIKDRDDASGYGVEVKIPWNSLGLGLPVEDGTVIGYNFGMDYSSNGTGRTGAAQWWDNSNNSWKDASIWGEAILKNTVSAVKQTPTVANSFSLNQNYPNPFNPTTQIQYTIDKVEKVKLTVYNVLGNQVAVLVNSTQAAGTHSASFDASRFASGVYFYKLEAGAKTMSKKMLLLK